MKALVDPRDNRVCQLEPNEFPVADPLTWVVVPTELESQVKSDWIYDGNTFTQPETVTVSDPNESAKLAARGRLASFNPAGNAQISRSEFNDVLIFLGIK